MNCNQAQQALLLEASGEIGFWRNARLHRHLVTCPACRQWQTDLARLSTIGLPLHSGPALNTHQLSSPPAVHHRLPPPRVLFPALAAALVLALAGAGWWSWAWWTVRQDKIQILARVDRLQEWTLLAAILNGDDLSGIDPVEPTNPEAARQALARQLLRLQDPDSDETTPDESLIPSAQHPPTVLPRHNRPADPLQKYG